jgi:hypothetical protein
MATALHTETRFFSDSRRVKWSKAALAGLLTGLVLFLANRGMPWTSSGLILPNVMGRNVIADTSEAQTMWMGVALVHLALATIYGLIIGPAVFRLRFFPAAVAGAVIGVGLYFLTLAGFSLLLPDARNRSEFSPFLMHVAYGIICAGMYKGISKRELAPELREAGPQNE